MSDKDSVIRSIYYDTDDGFDSAIATYRKANKVLNTITVADVKSWLENRNQNKPKLTEDSTVMLHQKHCTNCKLTSPYSPIQQTTIVDLNMNCCY